MLSSESELSGGPENRTITTNLEVTYNIIEILCLMSLIDEFSPLSLMCGAVQHIGECVLQQSR